jgi:hypothetical protein
VTIYIVTQGEYSAYGIHAVFTTKEQAMQYAALHNDDYYEPCMIEEYEADSVKIDSNKEIYEKWGGCFSFDGYLESVYRREGFFFDSPSIVEFERFNGYRYYVDIFVPLGTTEDKAKKIICDTFTKWKYEQMELKP